MQSLSCRASAGVDHQQRNVSGPLATDTQPALVESEIVTGPQDTRPIVTTGIAPYGGRIQTCPTGVRFHIQQESDIPASTQLYNQICFAIAARHSPPPPLAEHPPAAMQTGLHRNRSARSASWKPTAWWKPWPAPATCAISRSRARSSRRPHPQPRRHRSRSGSPQCVDGLCRLHLAADP